MHDVTDVNHHMVFSSDENIKSTTVRKFRQTIALEKFIHLGSLQIFHAVLLSSISEMGAGTRTPQRLRLSLSRHDLESISLSHDSDCLHLIYCTSTDKICKNSLENIHA